MLPAWALVSSGVLVLLAAAWLAVLVVGGDDEPATAASSAPASTAPATTAAPTESAEPTPEPDPSPSPEPSAEPEPSEPEPSGPDRSAVAVSVLNASRTQGLAATVGQRVTAAGWTVGAVGNWQGYSAANTVHYPQGREAEARLLADDLGIAAVAPSLNGMSGTRLTIVLIGPV